MTAEATDPLAGAAVARWWTHRFGSRCYELLRRTTSGRGFLPEIDGLRCYAIVAVVLHHCGGYALESPHSPWREAFRSLGVSAALGYGSLGVNLFFVISGFVLGLPFARAAADGRPAPAPGHYFRRRIVRIEPPYVINLLALTAALVIWRGERLADLMPHLAASLAYCHGLIYGAFSTINFVAWSLEIEVQFYVLAPLLAAVFLLPSTWQRWAAAASLSGLSVAAADAATAAGSWGHRPQMTLLPFLPFFLGGFLLADWHVRRADAAARTSAGDLVALPCLVGVAACGAMSGRAGTFGLAASFVGLCYSALAGRWHSRIVSWPPLVVIGGMCYTIYLYHASIMAASGPTLCRLLDPLGGGAVAFLLLMLGFFGVTLGVCIPLFLAFEKPFMGRGAGGNGEGPVATPATLPEAYRVMPSIVPFVVPGFERQRRRDDHVLAPEDVDCRRWYEAFADRVAGAVGRTFLPVCRMSDGEFEFLFGPASWNLRRPIIRRAQAAARARVWRWRHARSGFHAETAPGISSGDLSGEEWREWRPIIQADFERIARDGVLAMHLSFGAEPFHEAQFPAVGRWLREQGRPLTCANYVPFYFVYALLRGPRFASLIDGRRVLVAHSASGDRRERIRASLAAHGARTVEWLPISPTRAFADRLDVTTVRERPDICLVGAGIGKTRVMLQLEPLGVPCVDAGFTFEVWADPDRQWDRPYMTPDSAFDPRQVRFLPPGTLDRAGGA